MTTLSPHGLACDLAVLVVDMQLYFIDDRFGPGRTATAHIVPAINRLNEAVRRAGGRVVWISTDANLDVCADWTSYIKNMGEASWQRRQRDLSRFGGGYPLHPDLIRAPEDLEFVKTRFSAFLKAKTDLDRRLRDHGIERLIVCGTRTDICCESTVRDAMMLNYDVTIATDAMSADSPEFHDAAIRAMSPRFARAATVAEIARELAFKAAAQ
jgi:ureidoacrylate peracid hydrolase